MTGCSPQHLAANGSYQDHSEEGETPTLKQQGCNLMKFYSSLLCFNL